jgi:hypothetical protein
MNPVFGFELLKLAVEMYVVTTTLFPVSVSTHSLYLLSHVDERVTILSKTTRTLCNATMSDNGGGRAVDIDEDEQAAEAVGNVHMAMEERFAKLSLKQP